MYSVFSVNKDVEEWDEIDDIKKSNIDSLFDWLIEDAYNELYYVEKTNKNHLLVKLNRFAFNKRKKFKKNSYELANKLLESEFIFENGTAIRRNNTITSGVLIIRLLNDNLSILKLEETNIINLDDFSINDTYGATKKYFKIALMDFSKGAPYLNNEPQKIYVRIYDAENKIAKYWSEKFLDLIAERTDEYNTKMLVDLIKRNKVFNQLSDINENELTYTFEEYFHEENNFSFNTFTNYLNSRFEKDYKTEDIFKKDLNVFIDDGFRFDYKVKNNYFKKIIRVNEYMKLQFDDIQAARGNGYIEIDDDRNPGYILVRLDKQYEENINNFE